jgi:hypothetical protein
MEKVNIEELLKNLYICYVPSEEKQTLKVNTYHLKPGDKFEGIEELSKDPPDEVKELEVPVGYSISLLNISPYDIDWVEYSLFRMFDPDNPGERAMLWMGKAEKLPANSITTPTFKLDSDFGYHDIFGWTLSLNGIKDKVSVSFSDLRATGMFREEDFKDIPAINKKGYIYKVEKMEKPQRDMALYVGWEKIEEIEAGDGVEYFKYPQRQADK